MEGKSYAYKEALSELGTISNKISMYENNNAVVPEKLSHDFAVGVLNVLSKFAEDMGSENLDRISKEIDKYYDSLEEKVSADIGPLPSIKRALLIQGYVAIRDKLEDFACSKYRDESLCESIMNISNLLDKSCAEEFKKSERYRRKNFDYSSYFYDLRASSIDAVKEEFVISINRLNESASDEFSFYHYLELCSSCCAAFDAIILLGSF